MFRLVGLASVLAAVTLSSQLFASESVDAICLAQGTTGVGGNDTGEFVSDSRLQVRVTVSEEGITSFIEGIVMVTYGWDGVKSPAELNPDNAYIGTFATQKRLANPDYKPRKYVGYTQFKDFDAEVTTGLESGMWGEFLIAPDAFTAQEFKAAYIFKAGDHIGGTLLFTCTAK